MTGMSLEKALRSAVEDAFKSVSIERLFAGA